MSDNLKARWEKAKPVEMPESAPVEPGQPQVGAGETFVNKAVDWIPLGKTITNLGTTGVMQLAKALGVGDSGVKLGKLALEAGLKQDDSNTIGSVGDTYRNARHNFNERTEAGSEQNPLAAKLGAGTGFALSMLAPLPKFRGDKLADAATKGTRLSRAMKTGALTGAGFGAAGGLDSSDLTNPGETLLKSGIGAGLGAAFGGAVPYAVDKLKNLYRGVVTPTPAADYLKSKGVDLTIGQMDPASKVAHAEEVGMSTAVGNTIKNMRQGAREQWQDAVLKEVHPLGGQPRGDSVAEKLDDIYRKFDAGYSPIESESIKATYGGTPLKEHVREAFNLIPGDPGVITDEATREAVRRYLLNQATTLDTVPLRVANLADDAATTASRALPSGEAALASGGAAGAPRAAQEFEMAAEPLMAMRSQIRSKGRQSLRGGSPKFEQAELLENAENALTSALENQLSPESAAALRLLDRKYGQYKSVEQAVARSGDQANGFTPAQLSAVLKSGAERGAYARGEGDELRRLASTGREALEGRVPVTGAQKLFSVLGPAIGPLAVLANTNTGKRLLLGETAPQKFAQKAEGALSGLLPPGSSSKALGEGVSRLLPVSESSAHRLMPGQPSFAENDDAKRRLELEAMIRTLDEERSRRVAGR